MIRCFALIYIYEKKERMKQEVALVRPSMSAVCKTKKKAEGARESAETHFVKL
jgi:hypothetical protein